MKSKKNISLVIKLSLLLILFTALSPLLTYGQFKPIAVDINFDGRQEQEVHEPGFHSWILGGGHSPVFTTDSITFEIVTDAGYTSSWYKAGVQSPYFARLVNDGISSLDMELHISGLSVGKHSLVTYHNAFSNPDNNTYAPMDIMVNGELIYENLEQSVRATSTEDALSAYVEFEVGEGETAVIRFLGDDTGGHTVTGAHLNGFKLDAQDESKQASHPYPSDLNEHANADDGTIQLRWKSAEGAVSHNVYFGTDEESVFYADPNSVEFMSNQTDTTLTVQIPNLSDYFWRVDEITAEDTTRGSLWSFKRRRVAFHGAEGYGAYAIGGRGGDVVYVTNLNDSGDGSFRAAVEEATGPRTILFAVSGIITLNSRLVMRNDYMTIAGQTAPGKGICIRWAPIGVTGDNLIVRHLRVRLGIGVTYDGMGLTGANNSIIDHCSISWTIDEAFSSRGANNITLQRTLISEALNAAGHSNYPPGKAHGYAASIGGDIGSFHHNLLAHCAGRNWSLAGGLDGNGYYSGKLDLTNNVVYNWDGRTTDGGAHEVNFVNNYYKPGPAIDRTVALTAQHEAVGKGTQRYYFAGNVMPGYFDENSQEKGRDIQGSVNYQTFVSQPFFPSQVTTQKADHAYKLVLSDVGATQPAFDDHDVRMVTETRDGTTSLNGSVTRKPGLPDHEKDAGYWEEYPGYKRASEWDTDLDGLPDWWENALGTSPNSEQGDFSDSNGDQDGDLFTNLEEYLEWMGDPHYFIIKGIETEIDLNHYSRGFTNGKSFTITDVVNGEANLEAASGVVKFTSSADGFSEFTFTVTDASNFSMTRTIRFFSGEIPTAEAFGYTYYLDRDETELIQVGEAEEPTDTASVLNIKKESFGIWPNPTTGVLNVHLNHGNYEKSDIVITDLAGKSVPINVDPKSTGTGGFQLNISSLKDGVYIIRIHNNNNKEWISRFIKK